MEFKKKNYYNQNKALGQTLSKFEWSMKRSERKWFFIFKSARTRNILELNIIHINLGPGVEWRGI